MDLVEKFCESWLVDVELGLFCHIAISNMKNELECSIVIYKNIMETLEGISNLQTHFLNIFLGLLSLNFVLFVLLDSFAVTPCNMFEMFDTNNLHYYK